jgi:PAS domain S-box-containing protein
VPSPAPTRSPGLPLALGTIALLLVLDRALGGTTVPIGLFVVGPLLAAVLSPPRATAVAAVVSVGAALLVGLNDDLATGELLSRLSTVVVGGVLAVYLARQRERREAAELRRQGLDHLATAALVRRLEDAQRVGRMGSWDHDLTTGAVSWSAGMGRIVGVDASTVTDLESAARHVVPEERERLTEIYRAAMRDGGGFEYSQRMVGVDGTERLTIVTGEAVRSSDGEIVRLQGITRDVTEERRSAERLDAMREELAVTGEVITTLQHALLPQSLPTDPRYEIAAVYQPVDDRADIGGDWYDAFLTADRRLGLSIGDVAGHGLGATALMAHGRLALRSVGFAEPAPGETAGRVDRMLREESQRGTFATAVVGTYDPDTGRFRWSRAGHCPPVLLGDAVSVLEATGGPPLAAGLGPSCYPEEDVTLAVGDTLELFTDGLVERHVRPFQHGVDRLCEVLADVRSTPLSTLVTELPARLSEAGPLEDDCCVLALRRLA